MRALVVVWADPGDTTGWSIHRAPIGLLLREGQVGAMRQVKWQIGQFKPGNTSSSVDQYLDLCRAAYERLCDEEDIFVIGREGFILMMQSTEPSLLEPVRFNAVLDDRLRGTGVWAETQMPSAAKNTITDQRLKLWGVYKPGAEHARDAQRHGLLFLRRFATDKRLREKHGWKAEDDEGEEG